MILLENAFMNLKEVLPNVWLSEDGRLFRVREITARRGAPRSNRGQSKYLTAILDGVQQGKTQAAIARELGTHQSYVALVLQKYRSAAPN